MRSSPADLIGARNAAVLPRHSSPRQAAVRELEAGAQRVEAHGPVEGPGAGEVQQREDIVRARPHLQNPTRAGPPNRQARVCPGCFRKFAGVSTVFEGSVWGRF